MLHAIGGWAERWTELTTEHSDPEMVLWSWCQEFLRRDLLPDRRVVVRFDFSFGGRKARGWLLIEGREGELCRVDPGFGDDLVVTITDPLAFTHWHMGRVELGGGAAIRWDPGERPAGPEPGPADLERRAGDQRPQARGTRADPRGHAGVPAVSLPRRQRPHRAQRRPEPTPTDLPLALLATLGSLGDSGQRRHGVCGRDNVTSVRGG